MSENLKPWFQFYQHFTHSFYTRRSQKQKKSDNLKVSFALLESAQVKAACRMLMKLTQGRMLNALD